MAKLTTEQRNALPRSAFALPATREYPINNRSHAQAALGRAAANATPEEQAKIRAAVRRKFSDMAVAYKKDGK